MILHLHLRTRTRTHARRHPLRTRNQLGHKLQRLRGIFVIDETPVVQAEPQYFIGAPPKKLFGASGPVDNDEIGRPLDDGQRCVFEMEGTDAHVLQRLGFGELSCMPLMGFALHERGLLIEQVFLLSRPAKQKPHKEAMPQPDVHQKLRQHRSRRTCQPIWLRAQRCDRRQKQPGRNPEAA